MDYEKTYGTCKHILATAIEINSEGLINKEGSKKRNTKNGKI